MTEWQNFEKECKEYLESKYGKYAEFCLKGGSNANISDILVKTKSGRQFYIEVKHCPAQCGQFVLFPDSKTKKFTYSSKNVLPINESSNCIIKYMNEHFDKFSLTDTNGINIEINNGSQIFADWIVKSYHHKKAEYIITNDFIIFPVEQINKYFDISAKYRVKRSGSGSVGKNNLKSVLDHINANYVIDSVKTDGKKLFVKSSALSHNTRFKTGNYEYMFSMRDENIYEIRKLSNTYNANVIFSVELKKQVCTSDEKTFILVLSEN